MVAGVYQIVAPSGRKYIGSAVDFARRWRVHIYRLRRGIHHSPQLQAAWDKYREGLVFSPILVCSPDLAILYEQLAIDALKPEMNTCMQAGSTLGYRHTEEARAKFKTRPRGKGNTGTQHSEETKARISAAKSGAVYPQRRGIPLSEEVKEKIRSSLKGRFVGASHPQFGKKRSVETRKKLSEAHTGKPNLSAALPVYCVELGVSFPSASEAARFLEREERRTACGSYIASAARGKFSSAYGYRWALS